MDHSFSPEQTYVVEHHEYEMAMSHTIFTPRVYRRRDRALLFDMSGNLWSTRSVEWLSDSLVRLHTWLYPGRIYCNLTLDLVAKTGSATRGSYAYLHWQPGDPIIQPPVSFDGSLAELQQWVTQSGPIRNRW